MGDNNQGDFIWSDIFSRAKSCESALQKKGKKEVLLLRGELDLKMWATTVGIQAEAVEALQRIVPFFPRALARPIKKELWS